MKRHWWTWGGESNGLDQPIDQSKSEAKLESEASQASEAKQAQQAGSVNKSTAGEPPRSKPRFAYLSALALVLAVPALYGLKELRPSLSSLPMLTEAMLRFNQPPAGAAPLAMPSAAESPATLAAAADLAAADLPAAATCPALARSQAAEGRNQVDSQFGADQQSEIVPGIQLPSVSAPIAFLNSPAAPAAPANLPASPPLNLATTGLATVGSLGAALAAQSAAQFPQVAGMARLARVPVIMYHDILPEKQVFFDVTPAEFEAALLLIRQKGLTPISTDQLVTHLSTGSPLPDKPILLSFDDGYEGHYKYVYPLLKKYGYPALFGIYTAKVDKRIGRSSLSWQQIREMAADPLVTIASHSVTHPADLSALTEDQIRNEVAESKRILEAQLGIPIKYFVYPEGKYDERTQEMLQLTGYQAAFKMDDEANRFAGASQDLFSLERIGQSDLAATVDLAYGGPPLPSRGQKFQFDAPVQLSKTTVGQVPLIFASGGRPATIHADSRYQVAEIIQKTNALAAVDGGFFSLEHLDSNVMIGPVFSQSSSKFVPGNVKEIRRIQGRPLVLISPTEVKYLPFDPARHNQLANLKAELPGLTDAFVAAAWLVKDGQPQPAASFGNLFDFDAARDRAYWGIDQAGRTVVGVSGDYVDSVALGEALSQAGLRDAVMLDSGASASLVYLGKLQMSYEPRPVPHVVAIVPPTGLDLKDSCKHSQPDSIQR